ncbi:hypothetical protein HNR24_002006 [Nesterenkonia jeotgali]|uniref:Uncharacterized protein n=1 Tax=Nesterenkonia jeotgali TaxID=317018 RepID=A0A839FW53_9MICC|nr:hypothetical protein [Nesterenkonia jeotgali]
MRHPREGDHYTLPCSRRRVQILGSGPLSRR